MRLATAVGLLLLAPLPGAAEDDLVSRGAYLAAAAGCKSCHTDTENDGPDYAGGHRLETPFGDFYTPNITPDEATGIGSWNDADFVAAVREGRSPAGKAYYPAFPYASYAGMTDEDVLAIKAYLDSLPAVRAQAPDNELSWYVPGRWAMGIWQALFSPWEYAPPAGASEQWRRGAYLARHLGHCGECHTPRNRLGALDTARELQGNEADVGGAPGIDPQSLADWSAEDLEFFLELGMYPDGDFAGGGMTAVIDDNTALLTPADRAALVEFLLGRAERQPDQAQIK